MIYLLLLLLLLLLWNSDKVFSKSELTCWKNLHSRQNFIFSSQFRCALPWQIVPLINQHKCPVLNSQAGHWYLFSGGQSSTSQHGFNGASWVSFIETKYRIWRSILVGILRHPCSKLCTDLKEIPKSSAICFWVFLKLWRMETNSLSFTEQDQTINIISHCDKKNEKLHITLWYACQEKFLPIPLFLILSY